MTAIVLSPERAPAWFAADRAPLLRWLIFTGATVSRRSCSGAMASFA